jgi:hypothetical protein
MRTSSGAGIRNQTKSLAPALRGEIACLRQEVQSSELRWVGYEESASLLEVEFHSGEIYQYFGVPARLVQELLEADSIGRYFNAHIRPKFRFEKVR